MLNVAHSLIPQFASSNSGLTNDAAGIDRRSWLKALEDAGLRDALRAAKPFAAEGFQLRDAEDHTVYRHPMGFRTNDAFEDGVLPDKQTDDTDRYGRDHAKPLSTPSENADSESLATAESTSVIGLAQEKGASSPATVDISTESSVATRRELLATFTPKNWLARNVALLPSQGGTEIWIRDASLTTSGLTTMLAALRTSMGELGTSLVRISLNGKTVYSFSGGELNKRNPKEE